MCCVSHVALACRELLGRQAGTWSQDTVSCQRKGNYSCLGDNGAPFENSCSIYNFAELQKMFLIVKSSSLAADRGSNCGGLWCNNWMSWDLSARCTKIQPKIEDNSLHSLKKLKKKNFFQHTAKNCIVCIAMESRKTLNQFRWILLQRNQGQLKIWMQELVISGVRLCWVYSRAWRHKDIHPRAIHTERTITVLSFSS